jgi:hypothetical protein
MRFSGHETFACRYAWLPKAIHAIKESKTLFADEDTAMVELGVGKNMVRSIRFWIEAAGMATSGEGREMLPTELGKAIFLRNGRDEYLEDVTTLWLLHWKIATTEPCLLAWDHLLNRWQEPDFTESRVLAAFRKRVESDERKASDVSLLQHFQVFLHTYVPTRGAKGEVSEDTLDCPLTELQLIVRVGDREREEAGRREPIYAFNRDDKLTLSPGLFAYCVNDYWQRRHPNEKTLSIRSIATGQGSPGQIFKIPEQDVVNRVLDLHNLTQGHIQFNESESLPQLRRTEFIPMTTALAAAYG